MFETPVDAWYVWLGVGAVSLAAGTVALGFPSAAPPDATAAARAVDAVAVAPDGSRASHDVVADRIRLRPHRIGLDGPGGSAHATFTYGPVTPTFEDERLRRVLSGREPTAVFDSRAAFDAAVAAARDPTAAWRPAPDELTAGRVSWGDERVTLVG